MRAEGEARRRCGSVGAAWGEARRVMGAEFVRLSIRICSSLLSSSQAAYGKRGFPPIIRANQPLLYEIELTRVREPELLANVRPAGTAMARAPAGSRWGEAFTVPRMHTMHAMHARTHTATHGTRATHRSTHRTASTHATHATH